MSFFPKYFLCIYPRITVYITIHGRIQYFLRGREAPTYDFAIFSERPHEGENILFIGQYHLKINLSEKTVLFSNRYHVSPPTAATCFKRITDFCVML